MSKENKQKLREYGRNRYRNMSEEDKQKLTECKTLLPSQKK